MTSISINFLKVFPLEVVPLEVMPQNYCIMQLYKCNLNNYFDKPNSARPFLKTVQRITKTQHIPSIACFSIMLPLSENM